MKQVRWLFIIVAGLTGFSAQADTDAVTVYNTFAGGYVVGGAGFSFVPAGRLTVTRLAYLATGQQNPIIRFWSDTNVIASYAMSDGTNGGMVYRPVSLTLSGNRQYAFTLQDGPLSSNTPVILLASLGAGIPPAGTFEVAPDLRSYMSLIVDSNGTFYAFDTNLFYLGANFSYQLGGQLERAPTLRILLTDTNTVLVAWLGSFVNVRLQQNSILNTTNWVEVTNEVEVVDDERQVIVPRMPGDAFFRLVPP